MTEDHTDPTADGAARVAQLAAMTISVGEALARLRAHRLQEHAIADERDAAAARAQQQLAHATVRFAFTPALDDGWLRSATTSELLGVWAAAASVAAQDPLAYRAGDRVEQRLRRLHPEAMSVYDSALADGEDPGRAMSRATAWLRGEYGLDPVGTPLGAPAVSGDVLHRSDRPTATERPSAASTAVRSAFPVGITDAMASAPAAVKTLRALPQGPIRSQLPAIRSPDRTAHR